MSAPALGAPQRLDPAHDLSAFDSGVPALDEWLRKRAASNEREGASRTYVVTEAAVPDTRRVVGYYSLATGSALCADVPGRVRRNMPDPIPVMILGRLAVDRSRQGRGLGAALLRDALLRVLRAAEIAGVRGVLVHAISEQAKAFYERQGFLPCPGQPMTLVIPLRDVRATLGFG